MARETAFGTMASTRIPATVEVVRVTKIVVLLILSVVIARVLAIVVMVVDIVGDREI